MRPWYRDCRNDQENGGIENIKNVKNIETVENIETVDEMHMENVFEEYEYAHAKHMQIFKCLNNLFRLLNNVCQPILSTHYDTHNVNFILNCKNTLIK